jgi:hypothetical protein
MIVLKCFDVFFFSVQQKLDDFAAEIRDRVCNNTQRTVYEQAHSQLFHKMIRKMIELAIDKLHMPSPLALSGEVKRQILF